MKLLALIIVYLLISVEFKAIGDEFRYNIPPANTKPEQKNVTRQDMTIKVGEVVKIPLYGDKSNDCTVEANGNSIRVVAVDKYSSLTLQGAQPGLSTIRILRRAWHNPDLPSSYQSSEEISIKVSGNSKSSLRQFLNQNNSPTRKTVDVPPPHQIGIMNWEGNISLQEEELLTVISAQKEWSDLWNIAFNLPAPNVDFDKYAVACVFLGHNADWMYDIFIGGTKEVENILIIPYGLAEINLRLSGPFRASGQYRMMAVDMKKGYGMVLEKIINSEPTLNLHK